MIFTIEHMLANLYFEKQSEQNLKCYKVTSVQQKTSFAPGSVTKDYEGMGYSKVII